MITITPSNFKIEAFYGYPTYQQNIVNFYDESENHGSPAIKRFFHQILDTAEEMTGKHLMDNKIAFKLSLKDDPKTVVYIGYKDNKYSLSLSVKSESMNIIEL